MATKLETMKALSEATMMRITSSRENWMRYLDTAAWLYKYPFYDQLLVYAQRPDARACAPIELWNSVFKRWVNKGAKGIALIDDSGDRLRLKYVFDVSDTNTRSDISVQLWDVQPEDRQQIIEELTNRFGEIEPEDDFARQLLAVVRNVVTDNIGDYADVLPLIVDGSELSGLTDEALHGKFYHTVYGGVAYGVLTRVGIDPRMVLAASNFIDVQYFDTPLVISQLGCATGDISQMILRQIERSVLSIERQPRDNIATEMKERDNDAEGDQSESERSDEHGTDIPAERGLLGAEPDAGGTAERNAGQIREDAEALSQGESQGSVQRAFAVGQADGAPDGDRPASSGAGRRDAGANGRRGGRERATEGDRPDGVGSPDEQPQSGSRRSGAAGTDLQLISEAEQLSLLEADAHDAAASFLSQQEIDDELCRGSGFAHGKSRICEFYQGNPDAKAAAEFLKQEYGTGGHSVTYQNGSSGLIDYNAKGLHFRQWGDAPGITLTWTQVQRRIAELIQSDRYLTDEEKAALHEKQLTADVSEPAQESEPSPEPIISAKNFRITDDALGAGGPKAKYAMNIAAIRALKQIESEQRLATPEEQEILSRYVGWGGLADAFDETKENWQSEYRELQSLLTDEEYTSARESVLNAYYTSPAVIKAIYAALEHMGFTTGNVLEPACGIGNFFGLVPKSMAGSRFYGVELDSITGRIAKLLYPENDIRIQGFEETDLPDSFFDAAIGNVPFGDYGVADKRYDRHHFLIHDYFFAKALDKVRPGGIVAFITSSGTMDKKNPAVRKYLAQRADLIGAVRLPNNAFLANAGTTVVTDILFLQKRDRPIEIEPDWVHLGTTPDGLTVNQYFVDNPDMILGELTTESTQYGRQECTVKPIEGAVLADQLHDALSGLHAEFTEFVPIDDLEEADSSSIPADPNVRNFSFTIVGDEIYYRENSRMSKVEASVTAANRIRGMIELRDCTRRLIELQLNGHPDAEITVEQARLNELYDTFAKKYGLINSRGNNMAFSDDSSYCLLCSLEVLDEEGNLAHKADMFTKRTIRQQIDITHVDTASEALAVSMGEKARVDLPYMTELAGMSEKQIVADLTGVIFRDYGALIPANIAWAFFDPAQFPMVTADEYLSGNVREKLWQVRQLRKMLSGHGVDASVLSQVDSSIAALEKAQPAELTASEIDVRLGSTWVPSEIVELFMYELFQTGGWARSRMHVQFSGYTANWTVTNKSSDYGSVLATVTYGTSRASGYRILEDTLNLRDVRIFDTVRDPDGKEQRVLNKKETVLAQQKQQLIKDAFAQWIWKDVARREQLTVLYNERFNSTRPREYDGSHIRFVGMNPEIELRPHQADSVARMLYGGNALLAHVVGAGKTFAMAAAAMELKRLGLCQKSLFVVPNHLTEQWAAEFLQLYPSANILVATRRDFEKTRRRTFCSRIATGDYDAIIIGHSQFEKIPMSLERQRAQLQEQLDEVLDGIAEAKSARAERFTIKQMERARKSIKLKLDKLNSTERKDDVITFEELGVDRLFVDEAHGFKNLAVFTKMRNIAGISQTEAQKSSDLFLKCRYMDELTDGRGVVFATGTPVSNSMTELYTMQRYLQYGTLRRNGLQHFDAWASTFGETVTSIELAPEGTGYRARTRFARFFNLPELIAMFKEVADIKTADMLRLPVPEVEYHNIRLEPSEIQRELVAGLAERAERVRNQMIDPSVDNMLTITNDGRKLALDQRLLNLALPDDPNGKVGACLGNVFRIWSESQEERFTQLVFCDLSTPKGDREFSVYDDLKKKLLELGVPAEEIAFIHDANTETKKAELFAKVRAGQVRILLGSTAKMGSGTNVQRLLYAEHHLDIPWRPADLEQREGRAIRQGNTCPSVHIYRYVTEGTFDAYMWATLENKQKFIGQIMTSKSPVRSCEDVDETALTYAEVKALATGDERIKEKMDLEVDVAKLKLVRANYLTQKYALEDALLKRFPQEIRRTQERITGYLSDIKRYAAHAGDAFPEMELSRTVYAEKKDAGAALLAACKAQASLEPKQIGTYCGFDLFLSFDALSKSFRLTLKGVLSHTVELGDDLFGNIQRIDNTLRAMPERLATARQTLVDLEQQKQAAEKEVKQPFSQEKELNDKCARLAQLDAELNIDKGRGEPAEALEEADGNELSAEEEQNGKTSVSESLKAFSASQPYVCRAEKCAGMEER